MRSARVMDQAGGGGGRRKEEGEGEGRRGLGEGTMRGCEKEGG